MARIDDAIDRLSALTERIAKLEAATAERHRLTAWLPGAAITIAVAVGCGVLAWAFHIDKIIAALESGGNTKLVTELRSPSSPEQLQASLSTVIAQVQTARANHAQPNVKKLASLADAVSTVIRRDPSTPSAWEAAGELVSFTPPPNHGNQVPPIPQQFDCFAGPRESSSEAKPPIGNIFNQGTIYHDCIMDLGDVEGFQRKSASLHIAEKYPGVTIQYHLILYHVMVRYHGGPLIPVTDIKAEDCTFDIDLPSVPPPLGQRLVTQLLAQGPDAKVRNLDLS